MFKWLSNLIGSAQNLVMRRIVRGKYDAAQTTPDNRRHWANADSLSAAAANSPSVRKTLRNRSRYEIANNSYARGMVLTMANDVIGRGPRLQIRTGDKAANKRVEKAFADWSKEIGLAAKLRTMRSARCGDGETFAILVNNPSLKGEIKLDLRLVEAEQIGDPHGMDQYSQSMDGILYDASGNPVKYRLLREHPGSGLPASGYDDIEASQVIHWFRVDRAGQVRGVPEITSALPLFAQLRRFTLAVISAAESAANMTTLLYTDTPPGGESEAAEPFDEIEMTRNMMTTVPAGWKAQQMKAEQPVSTYREFKHEILNEIARCLNMPFNVAAANSSGYNYSSGRLDHQVYFKAIGIDQADCEFAVLDKLLAAWLDEAALIPDMLPAAQIGTYRHFWFWDGQKHVDPSKEADAQATRLANRTTNLAREYQAEGLDWEEELDQVEVEEKWFADRGLTSPYQSKQAQKTTQPEPQAEPV
jgi:capsid protein